MREGQSQAAHRNERKGLALKVSDAWTVPLCVECHAEFDQGRKWSRDEKRAMFLEWLAVTIDRLARDGMVKA